MQFIRYIFDYFYKYFNKFLPQQFYYYLCCGTLNTFSDWIFYWLIYHFIVGGKVIDLWLFTINPHTAALFIVTPITFTIGFCLSKYITFTGSNLKTKKQIIRYALILTCNFLISYFGLKLCCEYFGLWATPSKMLVTIVTTIISFLLQKFYSFKKDKQNVG